MRKLFYLLLASYTLIACSKEGLPSDTDTGVVIDGIRWATRNVDKPGTFASKPESTGMYYQWSRRKGWAAKGNPSNWNAFPITAATWEKANDPCPSGWRVPTDIELESLSNAGSVWTTKNGVNGRIFGTAPLQIFLPAVGRRYYSDGSLFFVGSRGYYWSSMQGEISDLHAHDLYFDDDHARVTADWRTRGNSVRCVAES
jgi:uncharacterized protein (TIGR02145 family)